MGWGRQKGKSRWSEILELKQVASSLIESDKLVSRPIVLSLLAALACLQHALQLYGAHLTSQGLIYHTAAESSSWDGLHHLEAYKAFRSWAIEASKQSDIVFLAHCE